FLILFCLGKQLSCRYSQVVSKFLERLWYHCKVLLELTNEFLVALSNLHFFWTKLFHLIGRPGFLCIVVNHIEPNADLVELEGGKHSVLYHTVKRRHHVEVRSEERRVGKGCRRRAVQ